MGVALAQPRTVAEAVAIAAREPTGGVAPIAGGTDLLSDLDRGLAHPTTLLSLRRLPWSYHTWREGRLEIGSTRPLRDLELDPLLRPRLPGLFEGIRAVGGVALRNRATVGGNVARGAPSSDLLPVLLALDASVALIGPEGPRAVALDALLSTSRRPALRPGELIAAVSVPVAPASTYLWQRVRPAHDVSQVGVAVVVASTAPRWRVALGGVPPRVVRLPIVEQMLGRGVPTDAEVEVASVAAAAAAPFVTDKRATEGYRRRLVSVLVRRALLALREKVSRSEATR